MPVLSELVESTPIGTWAFSVDSKRLASLKAFVDLFVLFFYLGIYRSLHLRQRAIKTMPTPWVSCGIMMSRGPMNACGLVPRVLSEVGVSALGARPPGGPFSLVSAL